MPPNIDVPSPNAGSVPRPPGGGRRLTRIPDGKGPVVVGVDGKTLTELCGERASRDPEAELRPEGEAIDAEDVLEALECVCWWWDPP